MGDHTGHRERFKLKCAANKNPSEEDILELLLFSVIRRQDVRPTAERLLKKYGSIGNLIYQDCEELCSNRGVGENTAALIVSVGHYCYKMGLSYRLGALIDSPRAAYHYMVPRLQDVKGEIFYVMCLDSYSRVVSCTPIEVSYDNTEKLFSDISCLAMEAQSKYVLLFHGFPDFPNPTTSDYRAIFDVRNRIQVLDIIIVDYILFSKDIFISTDQTGMMLSIHNPHIPYLASIRSLNLPNNPIPTAEYKKPGAH